jgi:S1-C subfamily serine protease
MQWFFPLGCLTIILVLAGPARAQSEPAFPPLGSSTLPLPLSLDPIPSTVPELLQQMQTRTGMKIVDVFEGAAKKADLRPGDVILAIGNVRVHSFEDMQTALAQTRGEADIIFVNRDNGRLERLRLTPVAGKIGVSVVAVNSN